MQNINQDRNKIYFSNNNSYRVGHIAACDGIKSTCQSILSTSYDRPKYSGYYVWRTIFESDQENIHFHLGANFHVVTYPIDKKRISLVAAIKNKNKEIESWKQEGTLEDLLTKCHISYQIDINLLKKMMVQMGSIYSTKCNNFN